MSPISSPKLSRTGARLKKTPETMLSDVRVFGQVAYVSLNHGYVATIDAADVPLVSRFNWHAFVRDSVVYARSSVWIEGSRRLLLMHRLVMGLEAGDPREVDHRDGDGLRNRRKNLRLANRKQQMKNRGNYQAKTSRYRGVAWNAARNKWRAKCAVADKTHYLGHFSTEEEAAAIYEYVAKIAHGDFYREPIPLPPPYPGDCLERLPPIARDVIRSLLLGGPA